jgi:translation elongation factor EF-1beta
MEQILAHTLAKVNVMEERIDTNLREMKAEIRTDQEEMTARLKAKI